MAAAFRPDTEPIVLRDLRPVDGCKALGVNNAGTALVSAMVGSSNARTIIWQVEEGTWSVVGDDVHSVHAIAINDEGVVLGQGNSARGKPVAVLCRAEGHWHPVGVPDGWVPTALNNVGQVVGWATIEGLDRPWLREPTGRICWLPYAVEHSTTPRSINDAGVIVGGAGADHGAHALVWQPPSRRD